MITVIAVSWGNTRRKAGGFQTDFSTQIHKGDQNTFEKAFTLHKHNSLIDDSVALCLNQLSYQFGDEEKKNKIK